MGRGLAYLAGVATISLLALSSPASAKSVTLAPSFDIRQVYDHGNQATDDTVTYSEALIGVDGRVDTRRVKASVSYQYGRRFRESGNTDRDQRQSLFARSTIDVIDRRLTVNAGAFAALLNRDYRGQVSFSPDAVNSNLVQTYSGFVEPHFTQPITEDLQLDLNYRVGYSDVSDKGANNGGGTNIVPGGAAGDLPTSSVSDSVNQVVEARIGSRGRSRSFRWGLRGSATVEDIDNLDQRYRSYEAVADVEYVVIRGVSLIGNVGYQRTRNAEDDYLRDSLGNPVANPDGSFQIAPGVRRTIFSDQGLTFEGGLRLQPNRRTFINLRAGRRFGQFTVNGEARYQISPRFVVTGRLIEGIDTFGQLLTRDLDGTTIKSIVGNGNLNLGGCVFGVDAGSGTCLFNATQSLTNATFRNRSAQAIAEYRRRRTAVSLALIYSDRIFLDRASLQSPSTTSLGFGTSGSDTTFSANLVLSQSLRGGQSVALGAFANRYGFTLSQERHDSYVGGSIDYNWRIGRNLAVRANVVTAYRTSDLAPSAMTETASLGLRLQF